MAGRGRRRAGGQTQSARWPRVRRYGTEIAANAKISGASAQPLQRLRGWIESNIAEKAASSAATVFFC